MGAEIVVTITAWDILLSSAVILALLVAISGAIVFVKMDPRKPTKK